MNGFRGWAPRRTRARPKASPGRARRLSGAAKRDVINLGRDQDVMTLEMGRGDEIENVGVISRK